MILQEGWYDDRPRSFLVYAPSRTAVVYALVDKEESEPIELSVGVESEPIELSVEVESETIQQSVEVESETIQQSVEAEP